MISYWSRPSVNATLLLLWSHSIHIIRSNSLLWLSLGTVDNPRTVPVSPSLTSAWTSCIWISLILSLTCIYRLDWCLCDYSIFFSNLSTDFYIIEDCLSNILPNHKLNTFSLDVLHSIIRSNLHSHILKIQY
jgi:hypothetical protein